MIRSGSCSLPLVKFQILGPVILLLSILFYLPPHPSPSPFLSPILPLLFLVLLSFLCLMFRRWDNSLFIFGGYGGDGGYTYYLDFHAFEIGIYSLPFFLSPLISHPLFPSPSPSSSLFLFFFFIYSNKYVP